MKKTVLFGVASAIAMALTFGPSLIAGGTWDEVADGGEDAGDLPDTAQYPFYEGALVSITGTVSTGVDADMYGICLTGGGDFSASTVGTPGTLGDTQLFLFDASGFGVYANDDTPPTLRSRLPANHPLTPVDPGLYFLAISGYDKDPVSPGGLIFPTVPFDGVFGPTGPGGGDPISGWAGSSGSGTYTIALTGAEYCVFK